MATIFLTGGTGYLGSYVCHHLLTETDHDLALMVRCTSEQHALDKLYKAWQLHMSEARFDGFRDRFRILPGDLHAPGLGLSEADAAWAAENVDSVLHIAASLNRKSSKACFNTNLRGTLSLIKLAQRIRDTSGLERFSHVSTVAVAGQRNAEVVYEDEAIDWNRSDYDPYGRTKKFTEHMVRELLPDTSKVFFRPSIVMGDARHPRTTQFDMVRALCTLADLPVIPLDPTARLDIINADYVGRAIATIHTKDAPKYDIYHLSSGEQSLTSQQVADAIAAAQGRKARFAPNLIPVFDGSVRAMNRMPRTSIVAQVGALMKVFLPYITYDTVFSNQRVIEEMGGEAPRPFSEYAAELYTWSKQHDFRFPYAERSKELA